MAYGTWSDWAWATSGSMAPYGGTEKPYTISLRYRYAIDEALQKYKIEVDAMSINVSNLVYGLNRPSYVLKIAAGNNSWISATLRVTVGAYNNAKYWTYKATGSTYTNSYNWYTNNVFSSSSVYEGNYNADGTATAYVWGSAADSTANYQWSLYTGSVKLGITLPRLSGGTATTATTATTNSYSITYTPSVNVSSIQYKLSSASTWSTLTTNGNAGVGYTLTVNNANPGTTYTYNFKHTNAENGTNGPSYTVAVTTAAATAPVVQNVYVTNITQTTATVVANYDVNMTGATLTKSASLYQGNTQIGTTKTATGNNNIEFTNLEPGTEYKCIISASNGTSSSPNETRTFTTLPRVVPTYILWIKCNGEWCRIE